MNYGPYPAVVESIHDGDTFRLSLDLGWDLTIHTDVRLYGCNAPELATPAGKTALVFLETILHVGDKVTLLSHGWDKYGGRIDGSVVLADGSDLLAKMIAAGAAAAWNGQGPKPVPAAATP